MWVNEVITSSLPAVLQFLLDADKVIRLMYIRQVDWLVLALIAFCGRTWACQPPVRAAGGSDLGYDAKLWAAADALRNNLDEAL